MRAKAELKAEYLKLTFRHYYTVWATSLGLLDNVSDAELKPILSAEAERLVFQLIVTVAGERVDEIKYPLDWREAFKERWFPVWALKRWPVKYHIWKIDIHYPLLRVRPEGGVFRVYHNLSSLGYPHFEDDEEAG